MIDALKLLALFGMGVALGWWLNAGASPARRRVRVAIPIVFGAAFALFLVAITLGSNAVAMIAGLSLMVLVAAAVPIGLGVFVGWLLTGRSRGRSTPAIEQAGPSKPASDSPVVSGSVRQGSPVLSAAQRALLLPALSVASGFWVVIALGFRLHDQPAPAGLDYGLIPAALVFVVTVSVGLRAI